MVATIRRGGVIRAARNRPTKSRPRPSGRLQAGIRAGKSGQILPVAAGDYIQRKSACSVRRAPVCSWAPRPFIGSRDQVIVGFSFFRIRRGVHWRFPFPSNVIRRWRSTIAPWNRAGHCRRRSGSPLRFHSAGRRRTQFIPPRSGRVRARAANEVADRARGKLFSGALRLDGVPNPGRHIRPAEVGNRADARR